MSKKKYGTVNATILTWVNEEYFLNDTETANVNTFAVLSNTRWCIIDIMDRDIRVNCKDMSKTTQHSFIRLLEGYMYLKDFISDNYHLL